MTNRVSPSLEAVGDIEVELDDGCDQEDAAANALVPGGILQRLSHIEDLSGIHERGHAELCAAQHRGDRHAQLG